MSDRIRCLGVALLAVAFVAAGLDVHSAVDVRAVGIKLAATNDGLLVTPRVGVWHDSEQSPFRLHATLRQIRGGQVIAVLWEEEQLGTLSNQDHCKRGCNNQSCTGACYVGTTEGTCGIQVRNCSGIDNSNECLCNIKGSGISVIGQPGDIFELEVLSLGATDVDPDNNTLRVSVN
jgi:hypothetical protein